VNTLVEAFLVSAAGDAGKNRLIRPVPVSGSGSSEYVRLKRRLDKRQTQLSANDLLEK
jgi:hypothetical protein